MIAQSSKFMFEKQLVVLQQNFTAYEHSEQSIQTQAQGMLQAARGGVAAAVATLDAPGTEQTYFRHGHGLFEQAAVRRNGQRVRG